MKYINLHLFRRFLLDSIYPRWRSKFTINGYFGVQHMLALTWSNLYSLILCRLKKEGVSINRRVACMTVASVWFLSFIKLISFSEKTKTKPSHIVIPDYIKSFQYEKVCHYVPVHVISVHIHFYSMTSPHRTMNQRYCMTGGPSIIALSQEKKTGYSQDMLMHTRTHLLSTPTN